MSFLPSGLYTQYARVAEAIRTEVNPGYITLFYNTTLTQSPVSQEEYPVARPLLADRYGHKMPLSESINRHDESSSVPLVETPVSETLKVRTYWENASRDDLMIRFNVSYNSNVCKVIALLSDRQKLENASEGLIDGKRVKMVKTPAPYGLMGNNLYCVSYWADNYGTS